MLMLMLMLLLVRCTAYKARAHSRKATLFTFRPCEPRFAASAGLAYGKTCRARTARVEIRASPYFPLKKG